MEKGELEKKETKVEKRKKNDFVVVSLASYARIRKQQLRSGRFNCSVAANSKGSYRCGFFLSIISCTKDGGKID
ncbi:hypothetical protein Bca4012_024805 [Brassica carinata]